MANGARSPRLCIANTNTIAVDGAFPAVVMDESRKLAELFGQIDLVVFASSGQTPRIVSPVPGRVHLHLALIPASVSHLDRSIRMRFEGFALFRTLAGFLRKNHIDVIRADDAIVTGVPVTILGKVRRVPTYLFLAGSVGETARHKVAGVSTIGRLAEILLTAIEGWVIRNVDGVITVNRALGKRAQAGGAKRILVSSSFADLDRFRPTDYSRSPGNAKGFVQIRFIGRLEREKGIYDLLDAIEQLRDAMV